MINISNLNRYEIFICAAECGSISGAAKRLFISQPAVSASIKKLEESLGCTLFIRKSKGIELTESGRQLYTGASTALKSLYETENNLRRRIEINHLRIAASNVLCKYMLMPYLKRFTEKNPAADVSITCTSSAQAEVLLRECKIDVALMAKPDDTASLNYYPLGKIRDIFVCTPSYLEKLGNENVFENGNIMLLNKENVSRMHVDRYCDENEIVPRHVLEVNDMDLLIEFAKIGIGISCVVKQFVEKELNCGDLVEVKLKASIPQREAGFLYNKNILPLNMNILKLINSDITVKSHLDI